MPERTVLNSGLRLMASPKSGMANFIFPISRYTAALSKYDK